MLESLYRAGFKIADDHLEDDARRKIMRRVHEGAEVRMTGGYADGAGASNADPAGPVAAMLVAGVVCLKHEGFHEEREWRVIYGPKRTPSPLMEAATKIIGGVPQIIYKLPLDAAVSDTLSDLDLSRLFDRLIIGPSPYPGIMYEAFVDALTKSGVANAQERVFISGIPIRA